MRVAGLIAKLSLGAWIVCAGWNGVALGQAAPPPPPPAPAPAPAPAPGAARPAPVVPQSQPAQQPAAPAYQPQTPQAAAPARLGGNGESCRARADCEAGLMCVASTCRYEGMGSVCEATPDCKTPLVCMNQQCSDPNAPAAPAYGQPAAYGQAGYQAQGAPGYPAAQPAPYVPLEKGPFDGTRLIAGIGFAGGPGWQFSSNFDVRGSEGQFDLKIGGLFQRREISLAYAPHFYFGGGGTAHTIRLETANYHSLGPTVYWPIRVSIGGWFGASNAAMMMGLDLINIGFAAGPSLVEINLAKLRFISNYNGFYEVGILFGFTAYYGTPP